MKNILERPDLMALRIEKLYHSATMETKAQGINWYFTANHIALHIANKFNVPMTKVCGVIAALSPATNWVQNIADAHNLVLAYVNEIDPREVVVTTYGMNKLKAIRILTGNSATDTTIGRILLHKSKVNKTNSFYWNILYPRDEQVTIDRHAFRIALGDPRADEICMTEKRYRNLSEAYKIAGRKLGYNANQIQAITWLSFRQTLPSEVPAAVHKLDEEIRKQIIS